MNCEIHISKSGKDRDEKYCNIDDSDSDKLMTLFSFFVCTINVPSGFAGEYCHIWAVHTVAMCHCEGYGFQAVKSGIVYRNQRVWV